MTTDNKKYGTIKFSDTTQGRIVDMAEEQKAWDMFAAAALTGISTYTFDKLINQKTGEKATWQELTEQCCKAADAMMEQRKARMW